MGTTFNTGNDTLWTSNAVVTVFFSSTTIQRAASVRRLSPLYGKPLEISYVNDTCKQQSPDSSAEFNLKPFPVSFSPHTLPPAARHDIPVRFAGVIGAHVYTRRRFEYIGYGRRRQSTGHTRTVENKVDWTPSDGDRRRAGSNRSRTSPSESAPVHGQDDRRWRWTRRVVHDFNVYPFTPKNVNRRFSRK